MGRTILLERRQSESVGRRNSRTTFLRSDWPRPFARREQCGFRPKCSTVHQLLRVTELIHSGFAKHEATGILFLDIAKAFDKIWHDGLLIKLIRLDFPPPDQVHS
ncbi:RNA-directed DNA polymerase from mobile element jockey [Trichonephila clavipes]|nr:RNA-directed DNA polymerase from mobile element jockey [Trichonephila clavipes]